MLPGYADALRRGWSPDTTRDLSGEQLARLRREGPAEFLRDLADPGRPAVTTDGRAVPRLPGLVFWVEDSGFCGTINLRFQLDGEELPVHVSGHVGYSIVRWKQRAGRATAALRLLLPVARGCGLERVMVTCDADNVPSQVTITRSSPQERATGSSSRSAAVARPARCFQRTIE